MRVLGNALRFRRQPARPGPKSVSCRPSIHTRGRRHPLPPPSFCGTHHISSCTPRTCTLVSASLAQPPVMLIYGVILQGLLQTDIPASAKRFRRAAISRPHLSNELFGEKRFGARMHRSHGPNKFRRLVVRRLGSQPFRQVEPWKNSWSPG